MDDSKPAMGIGETHTLVRPRILVQEEHTQKLRMSRCGHARTVHCKIRGFISPVKCADSPRVSRKRAGGVKIARKTTQHGPPNANVVVNATCKKGGGGVIDANKL